MALWHWEDPDKKFYYVVIDTDSYAGNFDRQLVTYILSDGKSDKKHDVDKVYEQSDLSELIEYRIDDHGDDAIHRSPFSLAPIKLPKKNSFVYNSIAIFLSRFPTQAELKKIRIRAEQFSKSPKINSWDSRPKILSIRVIEESVSQKEL